MTIQFILFLYLNFSRKKLKKQKKNGTPTIQQKRIVDKILERTKEGSKLSELASLTDIQLYQLYLNN